MVCDITPIKGSHISDQRYEFITGANSKHLLVLRSQTAADLAARCAGLQTSFWLHWTIVLCWFLRFPTSVQHKAPHCQHGTNGACSLLSISRLLLTKALCCTGLGKGACPTAQHRAGFSLAKTHTGKSASEHRLVKIFPRKGENIYKPEAPILLHAPSKSMGFLHALSTEVFVPLLVGPSVHWLGVNEGVKPWH